MRGMPACARRVRRPWVVYICVTFCATLQLQQVRGGDMSVASAVLLLALGLVLRRVGQAVWLPSGGFDVVCSRA